MAQNKPIQRSIRMTEEVAGYLGSYRGEGFSDKLENLVIDALLGEKQRVETLRKLDIRIELAQERLKGLEKDYEVFSRVASSCKYVEIQFERMVERIGSHVSQTEGAAPSRGD